MAWQWLGIIRIEAWEKEMLSEGELDYLKAHEQSHKELHRFKPILTREKYIEAEREAARFAVKLMVEKGYPIERILQMELDYFFLKTYGLNYEDFSSYVEAHLEE